MTSLDALTLAAQVDRVRECERQLHRELETLGAMLRRIAPVDAEGAFHQVEPEQQAGDVEGQHLAGLLAAAAAPHRE
jgi:hypothetical protein